MYWFFALFGPLALALVAVMGMYWGLLGSLVGLTHGRSPLVRAALVAVFAVGIEWLRGDAWYLRFPWYTTPHALAAAPACIAAARWVGSYGLSLLIWFFAAWGAFGRWPAWSAFLLFPACWWLLPSFEGPDRRALLVQAEREGRIGAVLPGIPTLKADLAVLPECAYTISPEDALLLSDGPAALARKVSAPVVFGAERPVAGSVFANLAAVIAPDGKLLGTFTKQHPVPLVNDGIPGSRRPVFPVDDGVLGVAICYDFDAPEVSASLVRRGATVLVAPTLDAMSWGEAQHVHHELLSRLRAVENDRWVLRAASSGRSEAVNPHGVPSAEGLAIGEEGVVVVSFGHRFSEPLGGQANILGPVCAGGSVLLVMLLLIGSWRSSRPARKAG
jgi:apolipoprotein N-acyltransferase